MRYKYLFIDLDDTIWHTSLNSKNAMRTVFFDYGFDKHFESFDAFYDVYWANKTELWAKYRNGEISKDRLIVERFMMPLGSLVPDELAAKRLSDDFLERTTHEKALLPNCIETLEYLAGKGYEMHILSNGFKEVQRVKMGNSGLLKYFDKLILSDDAGVNKPDVRIFEYALKETGASLNQSVMIGDNFDADILGAFNFGMDQIWLNLYDEKPTGFEPTFTITDLIELKEIL